MKTKFEFEGDLSLPKVPKPAPETVAKAGSVLKWLLGIGAVFAAIVVAINVYTEREREARNKAECARTLAAPRPNFRCVTEEERLASRRDDTPTGLPLSCQGQYNFSPSAKWDSCKLRADHGL